MSCLESQLAGYKTTPRDPLITMPVLDYSFETIDYIP